ncbi:Zn(II)2Cys6 transcription factor [Phanerochaete sordida]|uniref:Zn(II)2Cys6 transcription factor n=1 Tax=Phanerochaete sordida TaxID=48140 RepID=A0A9P3GBT9_9APHY|nr:Zn(II)2Cys6 transcription factor [Phanerochaete sordida]
MSNLPDPNLGLSAFTGRLEDPEFSFAPFDPAEPLPEYTRSWGPHLCRPPQLPEHYDTRIDPNHIFLFAVHPITGIKRDFYVTPKPCEYCAKIRQVCSRSRPSCQRCAVSGDPDRVCHVEAGWVKLPGPKCEKPKLQKRAGKDGKPAKARASTSDNQPAAKRARTIAPHPFDESLSPLSSTPTPSNHYEPMPLPKKPPPKRVAPIIRGENGRSAQNAQNAAAASASTSGKEAVNGRKRVVPAKPGVRRGKRVGKRNIVDGKGKEAEEGRWVASDGTIWHVVRPPPGPLPTSTPKSLAKLLHDEPAPPSKFTPQGQPRIWAKSKAEFLEILPDLADAMKGTGPGVHMEYASLEPPMVYLEGHAWPKDSLTAEGNAEITLVRDFTIAVERAKGNAGTRIDYGGGDMMLVDEISQSRSSTSTPSMLTPRSQSVADARPSAVSCHPSQALSARYSVPTSTPQPHASSSRQTEDPSGGSGDQSIRKSQSLSPAKPASQAPAAPSLSGMFGGRNNSIHQSNWPIYQQLGNNWQAEGGRRPSDASASRPSMSPGLARKDDSDSCKFPSPSSRTYKMGEDFRERALGEGPNIGGPQLRAASFVPRAAPLQPPPPAMDDASSDDDLPNGRYAHSQAKSAPRHYASSAMYEASDKIIRTAKDMDGLNRNLISYLPLHDPVRKVLDKALTAEEERSNFVPGEVPQDIKHLLDCKMYHIPVVLVVSRDYSLLPFHLPEDCGICVLGFYKIVELERTTLIQDEDDEERTVRVNWHFKLRWVPGGENAAEDQQPSHPWWRHPSASPVADMDEPSPYSLLPMHLRSQFDKPSFEPTVASEVIISKGWHCVKCGRLNVQRLLCFQKCETCQFGNDALPVDALYVRDPHKMTPDATPVDTYPENVTVSTHEGEKGGVRTFVYSIGDSTKIKHIFTCNRAKTQVAANKLFIDIQMEVPLVWQGAKTKIASGPYFACLIGVGHEGHPPSIGWTQVPPTVKLAREIMETWAMKYAQEEHFRIDQLTIIAWHVAGSRKGTVLPNRGRTIGMLCLGADLELTITPKRGFPVQTSRSDSKQPDRASARQAGPVAMKVDESDDEFRAVFDGPLSDSSDDEALSSRRPPKTQVKVEKKSTQSMLITMVHGDILLLSGDEFEYALHRTGMGMLLVGTQYAKGMIRNG